MNKYIKKAFDRGLDGFAANIGGELAFALFKRLSVRFKIDSVTFNGKAGLITGIPYEQVMSSYIYNHSFSSEMVDLITAHLLSNGTGTFIDIGANIGLITIPVASRSQAIVHSFEPEPKNFNFLSTNVAVNLERPINLHNIALVAQEGTLQFELSNDNYGDHRIRRESKIIEDRFDETNRAVIEVQGKKLDQILASETLPRPIVIKMDVQGAEVEVVNGGRNLFAIADYVISEYCPYMILRAGSDPNEFLEFVHTFPYAAVLDQNQYSDPRLEPVDQAIEHMQKIPKDGSTARQIDVLLARKLKIG